MRWDNYISSNDRQPKAMSVLPNALWLRSGSLAIIRKDVTLRIKEVLVLPPMGGLKFRLRCV